MPAKVYIESGTMGTSAARPLRLRRFMDASISGFPSFGKSLWEWVLAYFCLDFLHEWEGKEGNRLMVRANEKEELHPEKKASVLIGC